MLKLSEPIEEWDALFERLLNEPVYVMLFLMEGIRSGADLREWQAEYERSVAMATKH